MYNILTTRYTIVTPYIFYIEARSLIIRTESGKRNKGDSIFLCDKKGIDHLSVSIAAETFSVVITLLVFLLIPLFFAQLWCCSCCC